MFIYLHNFMMSRETAGNRLKLDDIHKVLSSMGHRLGLKAIELGLYDRDVFSHFVVVSSQLAQLRCELGAADFVAGGQSCLSIHLGQELRFEVFQLSSVP